MCESLYSDDQIYELEHKAAREERENIIDMLEKMKPNEEYLSICEYTLGQVTLWQEIMDVLKVPED